MLYKLVILVRILILATALATETCEKIDIEKCYIPLYWVKGYRGNFDEIKKPEAKFLLAMAAEVRSTIPFEGNIRYGSRENETLDIYGGDLLPPDAAIYVLPFGGTWYQYNNTYAAHVVKPLFEAGIRVVLPNYDLLPQVNMDTQREDMREMANFVLALAEKNNSRGVWFGGHSSAGQMTAELMFDDFLMTVDETRRKLIKGYIIMSPLYDITSVVPSKLNEIIHLTREEAQRHSPLLKGNQLKILRSLKIPVVMTSVEFDAPGVKISAKKMLQYLMDNGVHVRFIYIPDEDHLSENYKLHNSNFELTRAIIAQISHDVTDRKVL